MSRSRVALLGMLALLACPLVHAQTFRIWHDVAPGSERWTHEERVAENTPVGTVVFNVVTPTLTAYLPESAKATGTAVIIAPGGAFVALAIDIEGRDVARWLQERGIAAFVLKYRIPEKRQEGIPPMNMDEVSKPGIADAIQALKVVRASADRWQIDPARVGMLGFSAGAMITSGAMLNPKEAERPAFAALLYGAPFGTLPHVPKRLPPLFMAWAQDDTVARESIIRFESALLAAGHRPELHIYSRGGHGFGMKQQGTTSDYWIEAFFYWLESQGLTGAPANAGDE